MDKYTKEELVEKVNERLEGMDVFNVDLANHVKDCEFCQNTMFYASLICEEHFKNMNVKLKKGENNG